VRTSPTIFGRKKSGLNTRILLIIALLLGGVRIAAAGTITHIPISPNVDKQVIFTLTPTGKPLIVQWDFGDGATKTDDTVTEHSFSRSGTYSVKATYQDRNGMWHTDTTIITIVERRRIDYLPLNPRINQLITFKAVNFLASQVTWDFDDGFVITGGLRRAGAITQTHAYTSPGVYTVMVRDQGGRSNTPITVTLTVIGAAGITFQPAQPRIGEQVTLTAVNFVSTTLIRWDFNDGIVQNDNSPPVITHVFNQQQVFRIRAYDGGGTALTAEVFIRIYPQASITFQPNSPRVGEQVSCEAHDFFSNNLIRWDFGDGIIQNDNSPPAITHSFNRQGVFRIRAYDGGGTVLTAEVIIRVFPQASITFQPGDPRPGEEVSFTAHEFFSNNLIRWDFGDGTIENDLSPPLATHTYSNAGAYFVRAYDAGGAVVTASVQVSVLPPRLITHFPQSPRIGEKVSYSTHNFLLTSIQWDFGDGTPSFLGGTQVDHIYQKEGFYNVIASDFRNGVPIPVTTQVGVAPFRGPRAPFSISFIQLRFDDGKSYKVVPRKSMPLVAFGDIKFEGSGTMVAQWMVDGSPYRLVSMPMVQAGQANIDSGEIPGLPTLIPGIHEVTLNIIQPRVEFNVPVIQYFVTSRTEGEGPVVDLNLSDAKTLDDEEISFSQKFVQAPPGKHFLLKGVVKNESRLFIPNILIRIYLGKELIDQKILKNMEAGDERDFVTSIFNSTEEEKKIYITLYNISKEAASLIYLTELIIITEERK